MVPCLVTLNDPNASRGFVGISWASCMSRLQFSCYDLQLTCRAFFPNYFATSVTVIVNLINTGLAGGWWALKVVAQRESWGVSDRSDLRWLGAVSRTQRHRRNFNTMADLGRVSYTFRWGKGSPHNKDPAKFAAHKFTKFINLFAGE